MKKKQEYVLRERDDKEINRLQFQHQVWKEETDFAIQKAMVAQGEKIIDLGCGPGYLSYDLLELVGAGGRIFCLDNSEKFIDFIAGQNIENIIPVNVDIRNDLPKYYNQIGEADKVFCRWVLMFVGNTEKIIGEVYKMLKPGGKFISIEYFNFNQISIFPRSEIFDHIFRNVWKLINGSGGDPDIGGKVFQIMRSKGFRNLTIFPVYKTGKANSPLWQWLEQTNVNHRNLLKANLITEQELELFYEDWKKKSESEISFITAPPLMITIGEK